MGPRAAGLGRRPASRRCRWSCADDCGHFAYIDRLAARLAAVQSGEHSRSRLTNEATLAQLPALHLVLTGAVGGEGRRRRRTRQGVDSRQSASIEEAISYLRENEITLTYDQVAASLRIGEAAKTITTKAS